MSAAAERDRSRAAAGQDRQVAVSLGISGMRVPYGPGAKDALATGYGAPDLLFAIIRSRRGHGRARNRRMPVALLLGQSRQVIQMLMGEAV